MGRRGCKIGGKRERTAAFGFNFGSSVLQSVPAARDQRHSGPHVCEPDRDPPADATAGSGYDRDLSLDAIHA